AAAERTVGAAEGAAGSPDATAWLRREGEHAVRLFGDRAPFPSALGVAAWVAALVTRRLPRGATAVALQLGAIGAIHPFVRPWAPYLHDWLLFPPLPLVAVATAEGILLAAFVAGRLAGLAWSIPALRPAATALIVAIGAGVLVESGGRGLRALAEESPGYAWPILGREIAAR